MKKILTVILIFCIYVAVPAVITLSVNSDDSQGVSQENIYGPRVNVKYKNGTKSVSVNEYVTMVLAKRFESGDETETLKAMGIMIRTDIYRVMGDEMSVDSETLGMEYFTKNVMKNEWGNNFEEYYNHVNDSVMSTGQMVITYNNNLIDAKYSRVCNEKTLSGTVGKNILNMEFPIDAEMPGGTQEFLLKLRSSKLQDDMLLEEFYDKVIEAYDCAENYYIILIHAMYDVPGKSSDGIEMFDASDEVYEYLLMSLCPVSLSKAGLSYNAESNCIQDRIRDWIVDMPDKGFLFPAFNDRSTDLHSMLYYTKKSEDLQPGMIDQLFGTKMPMSADTQKETFKMLIEDTLGEDGDYETVRNIHETLNQLIEEHKEEPEPLALDLTDMKKVFEQSGVEAEKMESFDRNFTENAGEKTSLLASNIAETRKFQIETPDIVIKVNPERADLVETRIIDGRRCLVIPVDDHIEVNGINVQTIKMKEREENQETYN